MAGYTIHPLLVGINSTDQGIMTYQRGYGQRIWLPIYAFLITGGSSLVLVDTGLEESLAPPEADHGLEVLDFDDALARHGVKPSDIDLLIQTHLHNDHCENTYKCDKARVVVQRSEYEFARDPHPIDHRYFDDLLEDVTFDLIEGDQELLPGLGVVLTPGHTPGGQSVVVETGQGRAVITGFCCNDKNFPSTGPAVASGVHTDAIQAWDSAQRMKDQADILIACHDLKWAAQASIP